MALVSNEFNSVKDRIINFGSKFNVDVSPAGANHNIIGRALLEVLADSCMESAKKCRQNLGCEETPPANNAAIHAASFSDASEPSVARSENAFTPSITTFEEPNVVAEDNQPEASIEKNPRHAKAQQKDLPQRTLDPSTPVSATIELFA